MYTISMLQDIATQGVSSLFKALADSTRVEICRLLAAEQLCVCQLVDNLGLGQSLVSHHVKILNQAGLLDSQRRSYWTYYRLRPDALRQMGAEIGFLEEAAAYPPPFRECGDGENCS